MNRFFFNFLTLKSLEAFLTLLGDLLPLYPDIDTNIYCYIFLFQTYNSSLQRKLIFHNILSQFDSKKSMMRPFKCARAALGDCELSFS